MRAESRQRQKDIVEERNRARRAAQNEKQRQLAEAARRNGEWIWFRGSEVLVNMPVIARSMEGIEGRLRMPSRQITDEMGVVHTAFRVEDWIRAANAGHAGLKFVGRFEIYQFRSGEELDFGPLNPLGLHWLRIQNGEAARVNQRTGVCTNLGGGSLDRHFEVGRRKAGTRFRNQKVKGSRSEWPHWAHSLAWVCVDGDPRKGVVKFVEDAAPFEILIDNSYRVVKYVRSLKGEWADRLDERFAIDGPGLATDIEPPRRA